MIISNEEYQKLIEYKESFLELCQIGKKGGKAYRELQDRRKMENFFKKRYGETYKVMRNEYDRSDPC